MLFGFSRIVLETLWALLRVRVYGFENIPREGAAILAINHASMLDPLLAGTIIGRIRRFRSLGKKELFDVPVIGAYLRAVGGIPLDRDRGDPTAIKSAIEFLSSGQLFLMAPEGTRGKSDRPRTPKPGVAFLAHRTGVPVVPVRVFGTESSPPLPGRLWIRFGEPIRFQSEVMEPAELRAAYQRFADELMRRIYAMTEEGQ